MAKLLISGDWHLTMNKPVNRTDNYFETMLGKLRWIAKIYHDNKCMALLQPGDFFDSYKANDFTKQHLIRHFNVSDMDIYTTYGQHDLRFHSADRRNTPLSVLQAAGTVAIPEPVISPWSDLKIYAAGWGDDTPKPVQARINVLITHKMFIDNNKVWEGQESFTRALPFLKEHDFRLVVSGDNHKSFTVSYKDKLLINCGSLMRSNIDQAEHQPCIYIYDTDTYEAVKYLIPVKPFHEVMNMEDAVKEKMKNEELKAFVSELKTEELLDIDFAKNLAEYIAANKVESGVTAVINEALV
jgi:DNA repair exonuclease SbcCD nuclease subunit